MAGGKSGVSRRRWMIPTVVMTVLILVAGLVAGVKLLVTGWGPAPASAAGKPVPVHTVHGSTVKVPAMHPYHAPPTSWPAAQTATASLSNPAAAGNKPLALASGPSAGSSRAGNLPVWVGPPDVTSRAPGETSTSAVVHPVSPPASSVSRVQVSMASHSIAAAAGVHGVVFSVARDDGSIAAGQVHVSLNYTSFAHAYGGDYAARLRLVELPACALTTPQIAACRKQIPLQTGSADSVRGSEVGADVSLPGLVTTSAEVRVDGTALTSMLTSSATSSTVVLAATAAVSGSGGDYSTEPLSETSEWVNGPSSGAYTNSYKITVPPVPGGLEPTVSLQYNSQATDGLTSATNNQASWIGDGWDYSPGFIETEFKPCSSQTNGGFNPDTGDLCPDSTGQITTLSLNGTSTSLVHGTSGWKAEADDGARVQDLGSVGTASEYWEVTQADGTSYYFGLNQLPGYATGDQTTNSAWTAPVWETKQYLPEVWRWNLDYVTDTHGDAIAYFYNTQTNYYAEDNGTTGTAQYTQGGTLAKIEYGARDGSIYTHTPAAQVNFTTSSTRQDAPTDLSCASGAACTVTAPTFWTGAALTGISTQSLAGSSLQNVDSWALSGTYPATNDPTTSPSLWLTSITRTGQDGPASITLPAESFAGTPMPNRVQTAADTAAGYSLITRLRLTSVTNETGGTTTVRYSGEDPACSSGSFPTIYQNSTLCYPGYWLPPGATTQVLDWFNLHTAGKVTDTDTTGGDPPVISNYIFTTPGWHFDDDTVSRSLTKTWDQWRGFRTVTTETGTAPDPVTETVDTNFQGMSGDKSGCTPTPCNTTVTLTSTHGDTATDSDQYAGMTFESIVYNGAGTGTQVTDTIHTTTSTMTGTDSKTSISSFVAEENGTKTYTALAGGSNRESTVSYTYDTHGRVSTQSDVPDTTDASQDTCTTTTYNTDTTDWVFNQQAEVNITALPCTTSPTQASQIVSDIKYTYNSGGDITQTQKASAVTVTVPNTIRYTYATVQAATYDQYGRVLTSADADQRITTTAYTPATGAEPTSAQVTDPATLVTTTTYDPARDLATGVTDPAGYQTAETYDALGRETASWSAGNPTSGPAVDKYTYTVSNTAPSVTTQQTEVPGGGYSTTEAINDSFGQPRETQTQTAGGGTNVSDTSYSSDGWKSLISDPYYVSGAPSATLVAAASSSVPSQTGYVYDGDGRVTKQIAYALGTETWETDSTYGGNYVTVVPPSGGTSQTTFTDGRGLTTAIYQYHAGVPADPTDPAADYDKTGYTYTPAKQLATITDAAGNGWSDTYDLLGDQVSQTDPDAGISTSTYDNAKQLISTTDARGKTISYTYDGDGRKTADYDTTGGALETTADQLSSWTYDTLAKGKLTSSTSFSGGASYIEQVTGYNTQGMPSGSETIIPTMQGALAGAYTTSYTYAPSGQMTSYTDSAVGGLPAETITSGYDSVGEPDSLTGTSTYVDSLTYTNLGQPLQYTLGTATEPAYITDSYDPQTNRVTEQNTQTGTAKTSIDDLHYTYDNAGNATSEADTPSGVSSATDVQCFHYDYLGRLTQAWAQGNTGCAGTPSASAEGGAAAYWNTYTYDVTGNLTGITSTTPAGAVTTTTDAFPAARGTRPHAITSQTATTTSGSTGISYTYDAAGNLATVTGPSQDQTLTWNDAGKPSQDTVTPSGGSAREITYTYDASGVLLLSADPRTTTLYLPDEELSLSAGTVSGTRYYSLGTTIVAARTGASAVDYLAGDTQGTDSVAIDAATLALTRRYFDPYGNPRGPVPSSFPAGRKGFIGGIDDSTTALTDLGAREYQPATGSFISPDPLLKPYDPQNLNPYAYADGNPTTYSDPSGATNPKTNGGGGAGGGNGNPAASSGPRGCASVQVGGVLFPCNTPNLRNIEKAYKTELGRGMTDGFPAGTEAGKLNALEAACGMTKCPPQLTKELVNMHFKILGAVFGGLFNLGLAAIGEFGASTEGDESAFGQNRLLAGEFDANEDVSILDRQLGTCNSFAGNTRVLLSDGTSVPIRAVRVGDKVMATNPLTGKTGAEPVTRLIVTATDQDFTALTVKTPSGRATVISTMHHPYWDATTGRWTDAASLRIGDRLRSLTSGAATVTGVYNYLGHQLTYNLTVGSLHTYYVDADAVFVLVHNSNIPCGFGYDSAFDSGTSAYDDSLTRAGRAYQKHMLDKGGNGKSGKFLPYEAGANINDSGKQLLMEILTDPDADFEHITRGRFSGGYTIVSNMIIDGRDQFFGATFDANGKFQFFGAYPSHGG
ncbi:MAG TPA: polymorphic toxin-type HINT domain-containing protein [Streptosporangiaceae bacterium]|nr:polymorphic toxin-type HINT domain-containing protein [Streptosporangiaceae bacterium]